MTANMAMEYIPGMTVNNMKAGGKMENSTEKVSTGKMAETEEEFGKTERELSGSMMSTRTQTLISLTLIKSQVKLPDNNDRFYSEIQF